MISSHWIGTLAACLTTAAFVPQVLLVVRSGNTEGISLGMYSIFCLGVSLWLVYGLLLQSLPLIAANGVTLLLASIVLAYKIRALMRHRNSTSPYSN